MARLPNADLPVVTPGTGRINLEWYAALQRITSELAAATSGSVTSFEGRAGAVVSAAGDYTASEITNVPAGAIAAVTVQAAIDELDSEKIGGTTGGTDNALLRADGTGGKTLQAAAQFTIDDNSLLTTDLGLTSIDGAAWAQAVNMRLGADLTEAGTATPGSANQFGLVIHSHVPSTGATANYQKSAALFIGRTADESNAPALALDIVGLDRRGYIASTNPQGRAWGGVDFAYIEPGGDGLLIGTEVDIYNNGADQPSVDQVDSKYGITIVPFVGPVTVGLYFTTNSGGSYHNCMYADPSVIETGGYFIRLVNAFEVDKSGNFLAGSAVLLGGLRVGFSGAAAAGDRIEIGDANFYLDYFSGTPSIQFDTDDFLYYDRPSNSMRFMIGTVDKVLFNTGAIRPAVNDGIALGSSAEQFSDLFLAAGGEVRVNNVKVLSTRQTGWTAATNTKLRTTFDTTTVSTANLAARVGALIDDLLTHGIIGT